MRNMAELQRVLWVGRSVAPLGAQLGWITVEVAKKNGSLGLVKCDIYIYIYNYIFICWALLYVQRNMCVYIYIYIKPIYIYVCVASNHL